MGIKPENKKFWEAVNFINVKGPHHVSKYTDNIVDIFNAYWAWNATKGEKNYDTDLYDVTEEISEHFHVIYTLLNKSSGEGQLIYAGRKWAADQEAATEAAIVSENRDFRVFRSDIFTASSFFSPKLDKVIPATVSFNTKFNSITVAFEHGGGYCSAKEIVQKLWGVEADGNDNIAESPRGQQMTEEDFNNAIKAVEDTMTNYRKELNKFVMRHA